MFVHKINNGIDLYLAILEFVVRKIQYDENL